MKNEYNWYPPMKNCRLCGEGSCNDFIEGIIQERKSYTDCPFYTKNETIIENENEANFDDKDFHDNQFDFLLKPVGDEISARKIIRPFRSDLIQYFSIKEGDIVMGRPMGAGCPVTHVLKVYHIDDMTGVLYTWSVGPKFAREGKVIDIKAYYMVGFEGIAANVVKEPKVGKTAGFLPSFCMLRLTHYGLVNMVMDTEEGLFVRVEDIHIAH